jgi:hypothetical protein
MNEITQEQLRDAANNIMRAFPECHHSVSSLQECEILMNAAKWFLPKFAAVEKERDEALSSAELRSVSLRASKEIIAALRAKLAEAEAAASVMREALQQIWDEDEMGWLIGGKHLPECVKCGAVATLEDGKQKMEHEPPCLQGVIDAALTPTAGKDLLEKVGRVKAVLLQCDQRLAGEVYNTNTNTCQCSGCTLRTAIHKTLNEP